MWRVDMKHPEQVIVAHATEDPIVPFKEAKETYEANKFTFEPVTYPKHNLMLLAKEGRLRNMVRAAYQISQNVTVDEDDEVEQESVEAPEEAPDADEWQQQ